MSPEEKQKEIERLAAIINASYDIVHIIQWPAIVRPKQN